MSLAFYNELDAYPAQWLRNLSDAGHIARGDVDERSIADLRAADLVGRAQCHFFAGIGVWSAALRLAGWPDAREVWTGSCPCQPWSTAGLKKGFVDERHLWPVWFRLIRECRPSIIFGEQVGGPGGVKWLDAGPDVQRMHDAEAVIRVLQGQGLDGRLPQGLQGMLSNCGGKAQGKHTRGDSSSGLQAMATQEPCVSPDDAREISSQEKGARVQFGRSRRRHPRCHQCGRLRADRDQIQSGRREDVGQPVAGSNRLVDGLHAAQCSCGALLRERDGESLGREQDSGNRGRNYAVSSESVDSISIKTGRRAQDEFEFGGFGSVFADLEGIGYTVGAADIPAAGVGAPHRRSRLWFVANANDARPQGRSEYRNRANEWAARSSGMDGWSAADWIPCSDGKARPVEPGTFPLAHGTPSRVGRLRAYGNAIVPQVAATFIRAAMESL